MFSCLPYMIIIIYLVKLNKVLVFSVCIFICLHYYGLYSEKASFNRI